MSTIDGIWRLVESRAWDTSGNALPPPYGAHPIGQITISRGRMLAALCNGDDDVTGSRGYSSYGGACTFDGSQLVVDVDMASDPTRIGGKQVRGVELDGDRMVLRPPTRAYGEATQQRELVWQCVWRG